MAHSFSTQSGLSRAAIVAAIIVLNLVSWAAPTRAQFVCQQFGGGDGGATATNPSSTACGLGTSAHFDSAAFGSRAVALGTASTSVGRLSGPNAAIDGVTSIGAGANGEDYTQTVTTGIYSTAIGAGPVYNIFGPRSGPFSGGDFSIAIGGGDFNGAEPALTRSNFAIAIGSSTVASGIGSTVLGATSTANGANSTVIGFGNTVTGENSIASGTGNTITGNNSGAFGTANTVNGNGSFAIGDPNVVNGNNSFVFGDNNTINGPDAAGNGNNIQVVGSGNTVAGAASAAGSSVFGMGNTVDATNAVVLGNGITATGANGIAMGNGAQVSGANGMALGVGANAGFANSSAFGNGAVTTRADQQVFGTASNTYTMGGITSAASRTAQGTATHLVTSNASGDLAAYTFAELGLASAGDLTTINNRLDSLNSRINDVDGRMRTGVAMAIAMGGAPGLAAHERFAVTMNWGTFEGANGTAINAALRLADNVQLNAGFGYGPDEKIAAGRAGVRFAW